MPRLKSVPRLEATCLSSVCDAVAKACTAIEERAAAAAAAAGPNAAAAAGPNASDDGDAANKNLRQEGSSSPSSSLVVWLERLPGTLLEDTIPLVVRRLATELRKNRSHRGLLKALELLPRERVRKLDFGALFSGVRLYGSVNRQVKVLLQSCFRRLPLLTQLNLSSKCTDGMLFELAKHCPRLEELNVPISDITDRGLMALCGISLNDSVTQEHGDGCLRLKKLAVHNCMSISLHGIACVLRYLTELRYLYYDRLVNAISALATIDADFATGRRTLAIAHLDQFSEYFDANEKPDLMDVVLRVCPSLESLRFFTSDDGCRQVSRLPRIHHLQLEFSPAFIGDGFRHLTRTSLVQLLSLTLTISKMSADLIVDIGRTCRRLESFKLIGFEIESSQQLQPDDRAFKSLKNLEVRLIRHQNDVLDEDGFEDEDEEDADDVDTITPQFIKFILHGSHALEEIVIGAVANFIDGAFLSDLLKRNPLSKVQRLCLFLSPPNVFDAARAAQFVEDLPCLSALDVSKWNISGHELRKLKADLKKRNIDVELL